MNNLHRCRLCLKLSRNKIPIFKDDFPKMIEILTGLRVDPNDEFPKTSCLDCANNVKISLRTKKQIVRSHQTLLEEFLVQCKETNEYNPAMTLNLEIKHTYEDNFVVNERNPCNLNKFTAKNIDIARWGDPAVLAPGTITRSHFKTNKLPESIVATRKEINRELDPMHYCEAKEENIEQLPMIAASMSENFLDNTENNQEELTTKIEDYSDDSNGEPPSPMSVSDVDWTPNKNQEKNTNKDFIKPDKKSRKTILKASDGVFFVKKRNSAISKKKKTAETVIRIKKKPKGRTPPIRVTCEICKKEVQSYWLQKHMETHEYNPVTCEFCGLVSKSATALRHHVFYYHRSAADEYMCDQCGRSFRSKYRLNLHKKKEHGGTKDFECTTCGKKFFERMHLKRHVDKTHKNIRPYVCDFCGKSFKSRNHIKIHERIHSKEAPYTCHMCGESFKMKLTLRTHLKGVHNVQEVQKVFCDICKRGFASDIALKAHVNSRIHETEKCQYCSEMFTREYMINHLRNVHGVGAEAIH